MVAAIIFPRNNFHPRGEGVITNLPGDKYLIWTTGHPIKYPAVIIDSQIEFPINAYPQYHFSSEAANNPSVEYLVTDNTYTQLYPDDRQQDLIALKSKLQYWVSENLSPDDFYWELKLESNESLTRRRYKYYLMYNTIPCYTSDPTIFSQIAEATKLNYGPLILATYTLDLLDYPKWVIKELLRDMYNLKEIDSDEFIMVTGENTGELYLFYSSPQGLTTSQVSQLSASIRDRLTISQELRIFPRNTPTEMIKNRGLVSTPRGQFTIPYKVPPDIKIYDELLKQIIGLSTFSQLFTFLTSIMLYSTYPFIDREIKIYCKPGAIIIIHETGYLPDFLKVRSLSYVQNTPSEVVLSYEITSSPHQFLIFYDHHHHKLARLSKVGEELPQLERFLPPDYSLDTRIKFDRS